MIEGFREFFPPAPLDRYIERMAYAYFPQPLPPEQLAPDGFIKWSLILDGEPQYFDHYGEIDWHDGFCGHVPPERGIIATSDAAVRGVFVNFYPSAFQKLFERSVEEFNGRMIPPHEVIGDAIDDIHAQMRATSEPQVMFDVLVDFLNGLHGSIASADFSPIQELERRMRANKGLLSVNDMAGSIGLCERQLQRRFKEEVGLSPKEFCSVVRFNHVYSHMQHTRKLNLEIALECGYFDVSHMMKDLSYYLGKTPKRFASMIRPIVDMNLGR